MGRKAGVLVTAVVMAVTSSRLITYVLREAHLRHVETLESWGGGQYTKKAIH